jgi:hydrophobe/amphiphile efflux-1 (HAE1) family protein
MLSKFFLDRPVFAWVIAIVMMSAGGLAIYNLPISQYPPIAPPSIAIESYYPGASAETVENTVTQIIEQKMTGLADMLYLSGESSSSGASRIELTFAPGTDPDLAWSKVQNKLQLAMASLPDVVQRQGVEVSKSTRNYLIIIGLVSEDGSMNGDDLRDYAQSNLEKILSRVPGVGEVEAFGSQYAMRVWIDPDKLTNFHLTMEDVIGALQVYNVEVSAGQFGGAPAVEGQRLNAAIVVQHLLQTPEEFAAIPIRTNPDGSVVRIGDIGRTELGTERYDVVANHNGKPAAAMAIRQAAGANALDTADAVKQKMEEMSRYFPPGMKVVYPYDTTPFTEVAIREVVKTLFEAVLLVFVIMYLFMGTFRATLIPTIAVPVVLLGTFAILGLFGFSINMLTMFAMVLAIGLLVDDAIVVVENVERIMAEEGLPPREATAKSMEQITSALIGIGLVLAAVFGPMAFFPGSTGVIYRQFSLTIAAAMLLSVVVALILTPVLCAALLKPVPAGHEPADGAVFLPAPLLPVVRPGLFPLPGPVRETGGPGTGQETALPAGVCADRHRHGLSFQTHAHRLSARRRPGDPAGPGRAAGKCHPGADRCGHGQGPGPFSDPRKRDRGIDHDHSGDQFRRPGAEHGPGVCQAEGLGAAPAAGSEGHGRGRPGHGRLFTDQGSHGLRLSAAGGPGTGQCHRV